MEALRILFVGDVFAAPGMRILRTHLRRLQRDRGVDLTIANGENVAGGLGITAETATQVHRAGVDVITLGNHAWDKREFLKSVERFPRVVRPANYPPGVPGNGWCSVQVGAVPVAVVSLSGRIFMDPLDCPFRGADRLLDEIPAATRVRVVDFHAEATSEKRCLGFHLDGRVSAVLGTHTHVATADEQILAGGTGYITDVGMTGAQDSVIGVPSERALERFLTGVSRSLGAASGTARLCGVLLDVDPDSGRCLSLERIAIAEA